MAKAEWSLNLALNRPVRANSSR